MRPLAPLDNLFELPQVGRLPLPAALRRIYGSLGFPGPGGRPHIIANFASTLDGIVAFDRTGAGGGGEISGYNPHDRFVMGLLRAASDAVVVGAGTLRSVPHHRWTPEGIFPEYSTAYRALRSALGQPPSPTNVIVTARGELDLDLPVFTTPHLPVVLVTTPAGARRLGRRPPPNVRIEVPGGGERVTAAGVLSAVAKRSRPRLVLVEGGPHLIGDFLEARRLDELFLTLAPQLGGRDGTAERLGLVEGRLFGPRHPRWMGLVSVRRSEHHLFLRYTARGGLSTRLARGPRSRA